jgi:hypothetical protein
LPLIHAALALPPPEFSHNPKIYTDDNDFLVAIVWGKPDGTAIAQAPKKPESQSNAPTVVEAAPVAIPLSGGARRNVESERHSAIAPGYLLSRRIEESFYHRDDERDQKSTKSPSVRLRA